MFNIKPFEEQLAELGTLIGLHVGAKTAEEVTARADSAMKVAAIGEAIGAGDEAAAQAALLALATSATTDPGIKQFVGDLLGQLSTIIGGQIALGNALPILGIAGQALAKQAADGMIAIASKYATPTTPTPTPTP